MHGVDPFVELFAGDEMIGEDEDYTPDKLLDDLPGPSAVHVDPSGDKDPLPEPEASEDPDYEGVSQWLLGKHTCPSFIELLVTLLPGIWPGCFLMPR